MPPAATSPPPPLISASAPTGPTLEHLGGIAGGGAIGPGTGALVPSAHIFGMVVPFLFLLNCGIGLLKLDCLDSSPIIPPPRVTMPIPIPMPSEPLIIGPDEVGRSSGLTTGSLDVGAAARPVHPAAGSTTDARPELPPTISRNSDSLKLGVSNGVNVRASSSPMIGVELATLPPPNLPMSGESPERGSEPLNELLLFPPLSRISGGGPNPALAAATIEWKPL